MQSIPEMLYCPNDPNVSCQNHATVPKKLKKPNVLQTMAGGGGVGIRASSSIVCKTLGFLIFLGQLHDFDKKH
jgi:hypothetical protein